MSGSSYKVLRFAAHNVQKVSEVDMTMDGHHLFLVGGKNDQGKTSTLTALKMALCGRSGMDEYPDVALTEGQNEGFVKVDLMPLDGEDAKGLQVELKMKRKRGGQVVEEFRIYADGEEVPEPRSLLKRLYQLRGFDPLAFERLGKKDKQELLRKLVGLDFTEQKKEHQKLYKEREGVNRDAKNARARYESMPHHRDAPAQEVSAAELMGELKTRQEHNRKNAVVRDEVHAWQKRCEDRAHDLKQQMVAIDMLEQQLRDAKAKLAEINGELNSTLLPALDEAKANAAACVDADTAEIEQKIAESESVNRKVRDNAHRNAVYDDMAELEKQSETLTAKMDSLQAAQQKALLDAKWPVEGLSFDEDGVLYNGLPFEQASKSVRVRVSVLIGMALNPRLRLLISESGGDMDEDTLVELGKILEDGDYQMLLELVTRGKADEDRCQVIIEDGKVKEVGQ